MGGSLSVPLQVTEVPVHHAEDVCRDHQRALCLRAGGLLSEPRQQLSQVAGKQAYHTTHRVPRFAGCTVSMRSTGEDPLLQ